MVRVMHVVKKPPGSSNHNDHVVEYRVHQEMQNVKCFLFILVRKCFQFMFFLNKKNSQFHEMADCKSIHSLRIHKPHIGASLMLCTYLCLLLIKQG